MHRNRGHWRTKFSTGEDRAEELLSLSIDHAATFGKKQGCDGVRIHEPVARVAFVEQSVATLALQHVADAALEVRQLQVQLTARRE